MGKRLIDANALRKLIANEIKTAEEIGTHDADVCKASLMMAVAYINIAPTIDAVPCWIPCGERLPKEYNEYLCCDKDGEYYVNYLEDAYWAREFTESESIVAWMPLPEPYDGERKDNEDS